jgi:hypothetical protein
MRAAAQGRGLMKRMNGLVAILSIPALFLPRCLAAQVADPAVPALKGIRSVFVLVEELPQRAFEMGLTSEMIKNEAESKLRREGLSVPSFSYEDPYLYLRISVIGEAFSINLSLRDYVVLKRDRKIACAAATWMNSSTGVHRGDGHVLIEGMQELLDAFLSDLRKVNSKR